MFKNNKRKFIISTALLCVIIFVAFAFTPLQPRYKSLKVLPPNSTHDEVDEVMDGFKAALNIKCNYCHALSKTQQGKMDMASDANPKKEITRNMMRMTNEMNQKFMSLVPHADSVKVQTITCNTCHRGQIKPALAK